MVLCSTLWGLHDRIWYVWPQFYDSFCARGTCLNDQVGPYTFGIDLGPFQVLIGSMSCGPARSLDSSSSCTILELLRYLVSDLYCLVHLVLKGAGSPDSYQLELVFWIPGPYQGWTEASSIWGLYYMAPTEFFIQDPCPLGSPG